MIAHDLVADHEGVHEHPLGYAGGFGDGLDYVGFELFRGAVAGFWGSDGSGVEALEDSVARGLMHHPVF